MGDTLSQKIVIWARGQIGKQVGAGECWDLANAALTKSGASGSADLGPMDDDADYVWGDAVALKDVLPGDVLQFRDHEIDITTTTDAEFADGAMSTHWEHESHQRGHHTAIVVEVKANGILKVFEQHVKPLGPKVQLHDLRTRDVSFPSTTTTKKMKKPKGGMENATVTTTVSVSVSGTIWAYRPKAKP